MKKQIIILILVMVASLSMKAQYGGVISAVNNSNVLGQIRRNANALMTSDSTSAVKLDSVKAHLPITNGKLSVDSIIVKSGSLTATNPSVSTTGSAVPSSATMIGGTDGTNLRAIKTTTSGLIQMDSSLERSAIKLIGSLPSFASTPTVNIGTGGYSVLASDSIKYRISMKIQESSLPIGAATESTLNLIKLNQTSGDQYSQLYDQVTGGSATVVNNGTVNPLVVTQVDLLGNTISASQDVPINSTTSGQVGGLVQGAVTTSSPSYTTGKTNPLSLNTSGGLRVDGSGVTQPVSLSGHDSTTDSRIGVKLIQNPTITNTSFGISGTLPAFTTTPTFNIGTGGYSVSASDSTKYRKVVSIDSVAGIVKVNIVSGSGSGGGGDASAANQVTQNTLLQGIKTLDSTINKRLSDSVKVYTTGGFGGGGGGGSWSIGQTDNANSYPVTLSTDQEVFLSDIPFIKNNTGELVTHTTILDSINERLLRLDSSLVKLKGYTDQLESGISGVSTNQTNGSQYTNIASKTATGNITTQNLVPAGTATANSAVELDVDGYGYVMTQVSGTYTGVLSLQFSNNGTTWYTLVSGANYILNPASGSSSTIPSNSAGMYRCPTFAAKKIRITALAAVTGTATILMYAQQGYPSTVIESAAGTLSMNISSPGNANILKQEDASASNADNGVAIWGIRSDSLTSSATLTSNNGDYIQASRTNHGSALVKDETTHKKTYRVTTGGITPASSATDLFTLTGATNAKISITKVIISGTQTSAGIVDVTLLTRRTANSGGTSTSITPSKLDVNETNPFATAAYYTANPTTGTLDGTIELMPLFIGTTSTEPKIYTFEYGERGKPITLNSTIQQFSVNLGAATVTGGRFYITVEYTEEFGLNIIFIIFLVLYSLGLIKINIPS